METAIFIVVIVAVVIAAAYIIAKMDDRWLKEHIAAKSLRSELGKAKRTKLWLEYQLKEQRLNVQKIKHKSEALQIDYDRLLTDYHLLETEKLK